MGAGRDMAARYYGVDPLIHLFPLILLIVAVMIVLGYHRIETLVPPF